MNTTDLLLAGGILGLSLIAIRLFKSIVLWLFEAYDRETQHTLKPFYREEYFCRKGHFVGSTQPPEGRLCDQCISERLITAICPLCLLDSNDKYTTIIDKLPPYRFSCELHGGFTPSHVSSGETTLSVNAFREQQTYSAIEPIIIPIEFHRPPTSSRAQVLKWLLEVASQKSRLKSETERQIAYLDDRIAQQQFYSGLTAFASVLLSMILVVFTYIFALDNVRISIQVNPAIEVLAYTTRSFAELFFTTLIVYIIARLVWRPKQRLDIPGRVNFEVDRFLVATFISVIILPLLLGRPITMLSIFEGLSFGFISESIAANIKIQSLVLKLSQKRDELHQLLKKYFTQHDMRISEAKTKTGPRQ